jgi:hypothetical protein
MYNVDIHILEGCDQILIKTYKVKSQYSHIWKRSPLVFNTNIVMQRSIFTYLKAEHTFLIKHFNTKKVNGHIFEKGADIFNKNIQ